VTGRYRRVTIVGWMVAFGGVLSFLLRWRAEGLAGLVDIMISAATVAGGILLVHYGIEGLSAFIRTARGALKEQELAELRALMEEVEQGGWQEAFAALGRVRSMAGHGRGA
jgi:small neutral amino acid transporter SnatA (MarC family)